MYQNISSRCNSIRRYLRIASLYCVFKTSRVSTSQTRYLQISNTCVKGKKIKKWIIYQVSNKSIGAKIAFYFLTATMHEYPDMRSPNFNKDIPEYTVFSHWTEEKHLDEASYRKIPSRTEQIRFARSFSLCPWSYHPPVSLFQLTVYSLHAGRYILGSHIFRFHISWGLGIV